MAGVTRIGDGVYRVDVDGRCEIVHVAGPRDDRWAFWNGHVFRFSEAEPRAASPARRMARPTARQAGQTLTAPMPATIVKIVVRPGDTVQSGDTLIVLEAMKMELPLRAPGPGRILAVRCREGELVQGEAVLVELE